MASDSGGSRMRTCFSCNGEGSTVFEEGEAPEPCDLCEGTGYIKDGCYCAAREPFECCCGYDDNDNIDWESWDD